MDKNIVLVGPNTLGSYRSAKINDENLALSYLAAVLEKQGYQVEIIDARMNDLLPEVVAENIKKIKPFFLGISVISEESSSWIKQLGEALGSPNYLMHICMGGYFPSLQPIAVLNNFLFVDSVARGEGEVTIVELVEKVKLKESLVDVENIVTRRSDGSVKINSNRPVISNLDTLPLPKRYSDQNNTEIVIEGSRGCFGGCSFCAVGPHFQANKKLGWRGRSPESIVSEIFQLRKIYPNNVKYRFIDPDFFGSSSKVHSERILKLSSLITEEFPGIELYIEARVVDIKNRDILESLKLAGLKEVYLGIESGSEKILGNMKKYTSVANILSATSLLEEMGINYQYGYMMVTPWTDYEDIISSLNLLRAIGRVQFDKLFNELYVIPGTPLVKQIEKECVLLKDDCTGYYFYETNQLIKNIRNFSTAFETKYRYFSEDIWILYKDVQKHEQCHVKGAVDIQKKLSNMFIDMFQLCLDKCIDRIIYTEEVNDTIDSLISKFSNNIKVIRSRLDPSITFIN